MSLVERLAVKRQGDPHEQYLVGEARWWIAAIAEELEASAPAHHEIVGPRYTDGYLGAARWLREQAAISGQAGGDDRE